MYQYNVTITLQAGMVDEMNKFASRFMSEKREEIISEASAVADTHKDPKWVYWNLTHVLNNSGG